MKRKKLSTTLIETALGIGVTLAVILLSNTFFLRFDLTEDGRYSVSDVSKELLSGLDKEVFITIYYTGNMPPYYKNLEEGLETYLSELENYAGGNLRFQFVDPTGKNDIYKRFLDRGFDAFPINASTSSTELKDLYVLPYAEVSWGERKRIVDLIKGCIYRRRDNKRLEIDVFKARRNIEYNLITAIYNMTRTKNKTLGLLAGHGEYPREYMADLYQELDAYYNFVRVDLRNGRAIHPEELDALMILQPDTSLSEREKYELDQYLMRGGNLIFCLDQERVDFSIGEQASTLTSLRNTNLDDFFQKNGFKVNYDIVEDLVSGNIDLTTFTSTYGSNFRARPWTFHPLVFRFPDHPVSRNLNDALIRFGSTIDTFYTPNLTKEVILATSAYSRIRSGRQYININQELSKKPDQKLYNKGVKVMGMMIKGKFQSLYEGRPIPTDSNAPALPQEAQLNTSQNGRGRMAIISDGEFPIGERIKGKIAPLPSDNKFFMMNLIDIMSGQEVITSIRMRDIIPRPLDNKKFASRKTRIQILNIVLPLIIVFLIGGLVWFQRIRKRKKYKLKDDELSKE